MRGLDLSGLAALILGFCIGGLVCDIPLDDIILLSLGAIVCKSVLYLFQDRQS